MDWLRDNWARTHDSNFACICSISSDISWLSLLVNKNIDITALHIGVDRCIKSSVEMKQLKI